MKLTLDPESNMAYLALVEIEPGGVVLTIMSDWDGIALDYDRSGCLIGIELFDAKSTLPVELLLSAEKTRRERRPLVPKEPHAPGPNLEPGNTGPLCECKGPRALVGNKCLRCERPIHG